MEWAYEERPHYVVTIVIVAHAITVGYFNKTPGANWCIGKSMSNRWSQSYINLYPSGPTGDIA